MVRGGREFAAGFLAGEQTIAAIIAVVAVKACGPPIVTQDEAAAVEIANAIPAAEGQNAINVGAQDVEHACYARLAGDGD